MDRDKHRKKELKNEYLEGKFFKKSKNVKVEEEFYDSLTEWIDYKIKYNENKQDK
jgi:hypothetical protein